MSSPRIEDLSPAKRELLRRRLAQRRAAAAPPKVVSPPPPQRPQRLPLSFAQMRLWLLDRLEKERAAYNLLVAHRLQGHLDERAFSQALSEIVRRHEVLRTTFPPHDGEPRQRISAPRPMALPIIDLRALRSKTRERVASNLATAASMRPFNLAQGPLFRGILLRLSADQNAFALVFHHIISDGWSVRVLLGELFALYHALITKGTAQSADLPQLVWQYGDFALEQRRRLRGKILDGHLKYWRKQLEGMPAALELPTDRPRPAVLSLRGAAVPLRFTPQCRASLHRLAREQGTTPFVVLLSSFATLLHRLSARDDLVVGAPMAGRERLETENLIGCFVNTLVLRIDLSPSSAIAPTFLDLLHRVRETTLDAHAHQDLQFEKLVEEIQPERTLSRSPLFQVLFAYQRIPMGATGRSETTSGLSLFPLETRRHTSVFDLSLSVDEDEQGLGGVLEYSTDLFDPSRAQRWALQLSRLLEAALDEPDRGLRTLPLLSAAERQQLLWEWNDTGAREGPPPATLPAHFARQVQRTPEALALSYDSCQLSYGSLAREVRRLAQHLVLCGVGPETLVGICFERSPAMVIALFATLEAGGAYVPLEPSYPAERLRFMAADAGLRLVLTTKALASSVDFSGSVLFLNENGTECLQGENEAQPLPEVSPHTLAYVLYTSGSTGRPKGVMITHAAIVNRLWWMQETYQLINGDRVLQKTPFTFDVSVWEFFWPLLFGAELVMARPGGHRDSAWLRQEIDRRRITTVHFVPPMLAVFLEECHRLQERQGGGCCNTLRRVIASGEALPSGLQQRCHLHLPQAELHNLYGPTEAAVDVTSWPCTSEADPLPIGRPISNLRIHLLDAAAHAVSIGTPGELHIAGLGLARGYLGQPALSAANFVPNPFSQHPGARMYRSGDLARHRADGALEFLGRRDHQVKVRGFRIELAEIEVALTKHAAIREAVVLVCEDDSGDPRLCAWAVVQESVESTQRFESVMEKSLRFHLGQSLPEHMVPNRIFFLEALPLNSNGKVDRKALRHLTTTERNSAPSSTSSTQGAIHSPVEEILATIWSDVLGRREISPQDHFFELGGHSLLGARVMARIHEFLGVDLELRELFEAPTLGALAQRVQQARHQSNSAPPIVALPRGTRTLMSFGQERLWFLDQLTPGSATYNIPTCLRLQGPFEPPALASALEHLIQRHETLRATFPLVHGEPLQHIADPQASNTQHALAVVDLTALELFRRSDALRRCTTQAARYPFQLDAGPLFRCTLFRLAPDDHALFLNIHHIVSDGWSIDILVQELGTFYEACRTATVAALPPLTIQYADYAAWQRNWLQGNILERRLAFWRNQLATDREMPNGVCELPTDRPRPPVQRFRGHQVIRRLPASLAREVQRLAHRAGVTPFMTLLSITQTLLYRLTGDPAVALGTPVANRPQRQAESLIGFFVNTLVLRTDLSGPPSFQNLLARVRQTTLDAHSHQDLPFEKLVAELDPARDLSHSPFFQVMFQVQSPLHGPAPTFGEDLELDFLPVDLGAAKFDLTVVAEVHNDPTNEGLQVAAQYNTDLFDPTTARRLLLHFENLLASATENPEQRLDELELLATSEHQQLLSEWNDTKDPALARPTTLPALFSQQVTRSPHTVALSYGEQQLSYGCLKRVALGLTQHLLRYGAQPERTVGICLERGISLVVALLATVEAGAAFVPLDPTYPLDRLAWMVNDTRLSVLVTTRKIWQGLAPGLASSTKVLFLDEGGQTQLDVLDGQTAANAFVEASVACRPQHPAYVIYTSGSTGRPKGVMNSHAAIVNRLRWMQYRYELKASDRVLQKTPYSFDVSVWEFFWPFLTGAELVMAPPGKHLDSAWMVGEIMRRRLTTLHFVPPMLAVFLEEGGLGSCHSLRRVVASGEALSSELVERFRHRLPKAELHNLYGPTEAAIDVTSWACVGRENPLPIGRPIANLRIHLLDRCGRMLPMGTAGELYIAGLGLARGDLRRPALTASIFLPNPFAEQPGARMYRSGDLARQRVDGAIEFLGRRDGQVKVRGFRIELGEIETTLRQHPAVADALLLVEKPKSQAGAFLVAYTVPAAAGNLEVAPNPTPLEGSLKAFLGARLPSHMVPSHFVRVSAFPRTTHGKIDRRALPKAQDSPLSKQSVDQSPRTATERQIADIWCRVLSLENVGTADNFFDLGGHSLLMMQAFQALKSTFDLPSELPLIKAFEHPTVSALARFVELKKTAIGGDSGPAEEVIHARAKSEQRGDRRRQAQLARVRGRRSR